MKRETRQALQEAAYTVPDMYRRSFLTGKPYPEYGDVIHTAFGPYVVITVGYGGDGWILTAPLEQVIKRAPRSLVEAVSRELMSMRD